MNAGSLRVFLSRVDPSHDETAEPLEPLPLAVLSVAICASVAMFLRWKFQPMQDLGHHMALAAIAFDREHPGSLYPATYERFDPLFANSLLYSCARLLAPLTGVTLAMRLLLATYLAGVPLATLYAARVFGRSAWCAVLAVPLCYQQLFIAGVANNLFAATPFVLSIPAFFLALERPTMGRSFFASGLAFALFLAHAHIFLWFGVLALSMTMHRAIAHLRARSPRDAGRTLALSAVIVVPSLLLFARWFSRTFGAGRTEGSLLSVTAPASKSFGAVWRKPSELLSDAVTAAWKTLTSNEDVWSLWLLCGVVLVAIVLARRHRFGRPPVMELCCGLTALSYFVLPENIAGHDGIASRQLDVALWLLPCVASPIPRAISLVSRRTVVSGILAFTVFHGAIWLRALFRFESEEAQGLAEVLAAAPPRLRLHYVKSHMMSGIFRGGSWGHVEKFYMSDALGDTDDVPAYLSTCPIRYLPGVKLHRVTYAGDDWPRVEEIWQSFDLVLTRQWHPSPMDLARARSRADLLKESGDWQLWRVRR